MIVKMNQEGSTTPVWSQSLQDDGITHGHFTYYRTRNTQDLQAEIDSTKIEPTNIQQQIIEKEKQLSSLRQIQASTITSSSGTKLFSV